VGLNTKISDSDHSASTTLLPGCWVDWQKIDDARIKLKSVYPKNKS